ncbi:hypothetical protein, conserved [Leishmania tarentolae]|uniref:Uncharacterized protein n=1 Tax=Leishmania tarentolae TaxID=5689 RepID=A0A640KEQ7_LEITA|nr:hypothetical protein, conserved [Leishmania tarentolae]
MSACVCVCVCVCVSVVEVSMSTSLLICHNARQENKRYGGPDYVTAVYSTAGKRERKKGEGSGERERLPHTRAHALLNGFPLPPPSTPLPAPLSRPVRCCRSLTSTYRSEKPCMRLPLLGTYVGALLFVCKCLTIALSLSLLSLPLSPLVHRTVAKNARKGYPLPAISILLIRLRTLVGGLCHVRRLPKKMHRGDGSPARPRRHRLPPLPRHLEAPNGVCAGVDRPQLHSSLCSTRPPRTSGATVAYGHQNDGASLKPMEEGDCVECVASELRHTGLKPLLSRRPSAPLASSSRAEKRSSKLAPSAADAAATVATLNCGVALNEQPPVTAERAPSTSLSLSLPYAQPTTAADMTPSFKPQPPPLPAWPSPACKLRGRATAAAVAVASASSSPSTTKDGLPGRYRRTATQFIHAIERLNQMTFTTCTPDVTSFFTLTEEMTASGQVGIRKMARVPLLPLTLCTDGATVILVDRNGTERHGNYLQAVGGFHQPASAFTSAASSDGSVTPFATPHPSSHVLWWTLSDMQQSPCVVPLTTARAALSVAHIISGHESVHQNQSFPQRSPTHTLGNETSTIWPAKTTATLAAIQPSRLTLRYGEPLVLVFASTAARVGGEAPLQSTRDEKVAAEEVVDGPPSSTAKEKTDQGKTIQREGPPHIGYSILRDIYHGYLPSLLERLYPNGGIMLRGCWCDVSTNAADAPIVPSVESVSQQRVPQAMMSLGNGSGGAVQRSSFASPTSGGTHGSLVITVPMPLLNWLPQSTSTARTARSDDNAGAVDAETLMRSFRPTSLRPSRRSQATNAVVDPGATMRKLATLPDAILQFPPAVLRFLIQDDDRMNAGSVPICSGSCPCSSPSPRSQPTAVAAAPSQGLTLQSVENRSSQSVCATDFHVDEPDPAPNDFDSYRVHVGGDYRGTHHSNLCGWQLQEQWQGRNSLGVVYASALLHAPSQPLPPMGMAGKPLVVCESVVVLTPAGRVELVVPPPSHSAARPITITDVQYSLLRSAVGLSLRLRDDEVAFTYAPGTPPLPGTTVVDAAHVVLRLGRRASRAPLEAMRQQA